MKRILAFFLAVLCCAALTACAESDPPTQPAQPDGTQSTDIQNDTSAEPGDATEATEAEDEFVPTPTEDLLQDEWKEADGSHTLAYSEKKWMGKIQRRIRTYPDGTVEDISYYPDTALSKVRITTRPDGYYQEIHFLPNGTQAQGALEDGTIVYFHTRYADGSESESFYDENGNLTLSIQREADGSVETTTYDAEGGYCTIGTYPDGSSIEQRRKLSGLSVFYAYQNADGSGGEIHYDDSGREVYQCQTDADGRETGMYFDENGSMIRQYVRNPDGTYQEGRLENGEWVWTEGTWDTAQETE